MWIDANINKKRKILKLSELLCSFYDCPILRFEYALLNHSVWFNKIKNKKKTIHFRLLFPVVHSYTEREKKVPRRALHLIKYSMGHLISSSIHIYVVYMDTLVNSKTTNSITISATQSTTTPIKKLLIMNRLLVLYIWSITFAWISLRCFSGVIECQPQLNAII